MSYLKSFSLSGVEKGHVLWVYDQTSNDSSQDRDKAVKKGKVSIFLFIPDLFITGFNLKKTLRSIQKKVNTITAIFVPIGS